MTAALLDTQALLWWLDDDRRLSAPAREALAQGARTVYYSAVSVWEIAIKRPTGKLRAPDNLIDAIDADGFVELPVLARHGWVAGALPLHHRDPFDRMIVAQAQVEQLPVITADARIAAYEVTIVW